jgi:hypothetical protein
MAIVSVLTYVPRNVVITSQSDVRHCAFSSSTVLQRHHGIIRSKFILLRRPLASSQHAPRVSLLSRTSSTLQAQLAALETQLRTLATSLASVDLSNSRASTFAATEPLTNGYHRLAAASAAQRHAAAIAAVAASISSRTFRPAATKVWT